MKRPRLPSAVAGVLLGTVLVWTVLVGTFGSAAAAVVPPPPPDTTIPGANAPLVVVPPTCPSPDPAVLAFVGTVTGKDDIAQVVRFHIDQLRSGSASDWAVDGLIDIRYGDDYRFLDIDEQYLVGAGIDPEYAALSSNVRPPEPSFGGNDVVGVDDSAVECPQIDDPVRTLLVDGTDVDSGVMSLLFDDHRVLLATIAVPAAIAFAALLVLVLFRIFVGLATKGVFQLGRAAVTPVPDHRAVRVRHHRPEH